MADLSDEDKVKEILGDVENPPKADETPQETETSDESTDESQAEEAETAEPEASEETEVESAPSLTKQFSNLKGDTWETYGKELENAYQNSFTEALRLNQQVKDLQAQLANQPAVTPPATPAVPATPTAPTAPSSPELQYAKAMMTRDMTSAFDDFKKEYPQVVETDQWDKFQKASDGVSAAFQAIEGRVPTWPELFNGIAGTLGWQPVSTEAKKGQAIKDAVSQSQTSSSTIPTAKRSKVSDDEAYVYMRMKNVSKEQAVKDLSTVK